MFKSILSSKKNSDPDFFMVTPQVDSSKENYPAWTNPASPAKTRPEKPKKSRTKDTPAEPVAMEEAFDKLLVSRERYAMYANSVDALVGRTTDSQHVAA